MNITNHKQTLGLDISDHSAELVLLAKNENQISILNYSRIVLEKGIIKKGKIIDTNKLKQAIEKLFKDAKNGPIKKSNLIFALQENDVYSKMLSVKISPDAQNEILMKQAQASFPINIKEAKLVFQKLHNVPRANSSFDENDLGYFVMAARKSIIKEWTDFFQEMKIQIDYFDYEALAVYRGLSKRLKENNVCLVDMGATNTSLTFFYYDLPFNSFVINYGGDNITRAFQDKLGLSEDEASVKKKKVDLRKNDKLSVIYQDALSRIGKEIEEGLKYYQEQTGQEVERIILVGGGSRVAGLAEYFNASLPKSKNIYAWGDDFRHETLPIEYIGAYGLCLKELEARWGNLQPDFRSQASLNFNLGYIAKYSEKLINILNQKADLTKIYFVFLAVIFVFSSLLSAWIYFGVKNKNPQVINLETPYQYKKIFIWEFPVNIEPGQTKPEGKIISHQIKEAETLENLVSKSLLSVKSNLAKNEDIVPTPINISDLSQRLIFPVSIGWLVYDKNILSTKITDQVTRETGQTNFKLYEFMIEDVNLSGQNYLIKARIGIAFIEPPVINQAEAAAKEYIYIKDGLNSSVNLRSGPSTSYTVVGSAQGGEKFELLETRESWFKILFNDREAWVHAGLTK